MALKTLENFEVRTQKKVKADSDSISIAAGDARKLNAIGKDNHVYLVLQDPLNREIVKYEHTEDWGTGESKVALPVERDAGGTGRKNFGAYSCLRFELTQPYIDDLVDSKTQDLQGKLDDLESRVEDLENKDD